MSCADKEAILEHIAIKFQQQLNAGKVEQALRYWKSSSSDVLQSHALLTIGQLFGDIHLLTDSLSGSCDNTSCKVSGQYANQAGELRNVTYTFTNQAEGIKLSNIQTASL